MWFNWFPWRYIIRRLARAKGFLDPIEVISHLSQFAQPSEVAAPVELLRAGAVMHARGLINSQAIQHNLDWIWPYWVQRQFDPATVSFIPRAFSLTHINLTHRNWTAVGLPGVTHLPIVDPRGLVTPFFDGWSIDCWVVTKNGADLVPSRMKHVSQDLLLNGTVEVLTQAARERTRFESKVEMVLKDDIPVCRIHLSGCSDAPAWLVVSLRPFNPEGVSFIRHVTYRDDDSFRWKINHEQSVYLMHKPDSHIFSNYHDGDVYDHLFKNDTRKKVTCNVGMVSAAALYTLKPNIIRTVCVDIRLEEKNAAVTKTSGSSWNDALADTCSLSIPEERFQFLYDSAIRTLMLHTSDDVYAGPYTYKRFWFRDAAFILHALLCANMLKPVKRAIAEFPARQKMSGYFMSQNGEWDSNGQVLWLYGRYCVLTGTKPSEQWLNAVHKAASWIERKLVAESDLPHAGLLPAGFSAEHLGPNDFYYWDDFWAAGGLRAAAWIAQQAGDTNRAGHYATVARKLLESIERSLLPIEKKYGMPVIPASPYRRMDSGAVGSLAAGYPLHLWEADDRRLINTAQYLMKQCRVRGGFFHDITHSGINAYLTLHIAQVLLRAGDIRFYELMQALADLASPTGQWPEAIHPGTGGGCMGDGQHVWAASEWILMMRNCFVREEKGGRLVLCSGIPKSWYTTAGTMHFGPTLTKFGSVRVEIVSTESKVRVAWEGSWHDAVPHIEIRLPGYPVLVPEQHVQSVELELETVV